MNLQDGFTKELKKRKFRNFAGINFSAGCINQYFTIMKFNKEMRTNPKMCAEFLKTQIGREFNVLFSLLYPHGRMTKAKILKVSEPTERRWDGTTEFEATFTDGWKANYCTSNTGFFCEFERQF